MGLSAVEHQRPEKLALIRNSKMKSNRLLQESSCSSECHLEFRQSGVFELIILVAFGMRNYELKFLQMRKLFLELIGNQILNFPICFNRKSSDWSGELIETEALIQLSGSSDWERLNLISGNVSLDVFDVERILAFWFAEKRLTYSQSQVDFTAFDIKSLETRKILEQKRNFNFIQSQILEVLESFKCSVFSIWGELKALQIVKRKSQYQELFHSRGSWGDGFEWIR